MRRRHPCRQTLIAAGAAGFTLVELVVVMVMAGILAAVALPRMNLLSVMEGPAFRDELRSSLQFARRAAIAARRNVCVSLSGKVFSFTMDTREPDTLSGLIDCAENMTLPDPGRFCSPREQYQLCAPSTATLSGMSTIVFDSSGRPLNSSGLALSSVMVINVIDAASEVFTVTLEAETGLVH